MAKKVFVAAGHGGFDPGTVSGSNIERDIAIKIVDQALALLKKQDTKGRQIVLVPHSLKLKGAVDYVNKNYTSYGSDLAIEVHLNSNSGTPATGTETYYGLKLLAQEVNVKVVEVLGLRNRGVKDGNRFYWNNTVKIASCLVEMGFINNSVDVRRVKEKGGLALAKGILNACGGVWVDDKPKPVQTPIPKPTPPPKKITVPKTTPIIIKPKEPVLPKTNTDTNKPKKPSIPPENKLDIRGLNYIIAFLKQIIETVKKLFNR